MPSLFYFIVLVALFFSTIQLSVSFLGGWREIARQFPARRQTASRSFSLQNGCVGEFSYKACLSVHTSVEGISVGILFPFRLGHPPFFIPWSAIHNVVTLDLDIIVFSAADEVTRRDQTDYIPPRTSTSSPRWLRSPVKAAKPPRPSVSFLQWRGSTSIF